MFYYQVKYGRLAYVLQLPGLVDTSFTIESRCPCHKAFIERSASARFLFVRQMCVCARVCVMVKRSLGFKRCQHTLVNKLTAFERCCLAAFKLGEVPPVAM